MPKHFTTVCVSVLLSLLIGGLAIGGPALAQSATKHKPGVQQKPFGTRDGRPITLYTLTNANGVEVDTMNYGGIILSIRVPDRKGKFADIVLGHEDLDGYIPNPPYIGAVVGRYANRIANGTFTLDGKAYTLPKNDGPNTLHGGSDKTFNKVVWDGEPLKGKSGVTYTYLSKDGDDGFPGNMKVSVTYTLTDANELVIDYEATTDKTTVVNLSQHSYFNLAGEGSSDILNHEIMLNADRFTPVDKNLIPTGELRPVKRRPGSVRASTTATTRSSWATATTTTGSSTARATDSPWQRGFTSRPAGACWKFRRRSPECSSTPEIFSMEQSPENRATCIRGASASVWKPSTSRTHRTIRIFRPRL
jgi:aldose 1-epimerase